MSFKGIVGAAFACALVLAGSAASAGTIVTATYTGKITLLMDKDALLGTVIERNTATDLAFTNTFVFDVDAGYRITNPFAPNPNDNLLGGSAFFGGTPLISSKLTINGVTLDFLGGYAQQQLTEQGRLHQSVADDRSNGLARINHIAMQTDAPGLLTTPFTGVTTGQDFFNGAASICVFTNGNCVQQRFRAFFAPETVTVTVREAPALVPEPGAWAIMLLGFAGMGAALRRARAVAVSAA